MAKTTFWDCSSDSDDALAGPSHPAFSCVAWLGARSASSPARHRASFAAPRDLANRVVLPGGARPVNQNNRPVLRAWLALAICLGWPLATALAQLQNGDFDSGLQGWQTAPAGSVSVGNCPGGAECPDKSGNGKYGKLGPGPGVVINRNGDTAIYLRQNFDCSPNPIQKYWCKVTFWYKWQPVANSGEKFQVFDGSGQKQLEKTDAQAVGAWTAVKLTFDQCGPVGITAQILRPGGGNIQSTASVDWFQSICESAETSYVVPVEPGYSTLANNYDRGVNTLDYVLPNALPGTTLFKLSSSSGDFAVYQYDEFDRTWSPEGGTLGPGEGAWIFSPGPQMFYFYGEIRPLQPQPRRPAGLYLVGGLAPQPCRFEELMGFPPMAGDRVYHVDGTLHEFPDGGNLTTNPAVQISTYGASGWDVAPVIAPGQAAFVQLAAMSGDTEPPRLVSATTTNGFEVHVGFSERVQPSSVQPLRFSVQDYNGANYVMSAHLEADGKTVLLQTLDPLAASFLVCASGIRDLAGNVILPNACITGQLGTQANEPPVLEPTLNWVVHAGTVVSFTASASDSNVPPNRLSYSLEPGAPAGAVIDPVNGNFYWATAADVPEGPYSIAVRVTDDGSPPMSDTKTFTVVVVAAPKITDFAHARTNFNLTWTAIPGTTYRVRYANTVTGPWNDLPGDVVATDTTATKTDDTVPTASQRYYTITTVTTVPCHSYSFCVLTTRILGPPGIGAEVIAPPAGEKTLKEDETVPFIVKGTDMDQLLQNCTCIGPESICTSSKTIPLADSVQYVWSLTGDGKLLGSSGPATLYEPPVLLVGQTKTATIKVHIYDSYGNDAAVDLTFTITISRFAECVYKRTITVPDNVVPGPPPVITPGACDCFPGPHAWQAVPIALNADDPPTVKVCAGERVILTLDARDGDVLQMQCVSEHCGAPKRKEFFIDEKIYTWSAERGSFPDYGGAAQSKGRFTTAIYKAPDTGGDDTVTITIQDSGVHAPGGVDSPIERKIKIKSCKVDLQVEGVADADEECVGRCVPVNRDDDNKNDTADKDEAGKVDNENDLVKITLTKSPKEGNVTLKATVGGDRIKVWEKPTKETEVVLPKSYPASDLPKDLWVEGIKPSDAERDVELVLESDDPKCQDKAKLTVVQVDLVIYNGLEGVSGGQEISELEEEKKGAVTVANLNDTDGDGTVDKDDNDVSVSGADPLGRNEHDLMKLILKKPQPDLGEKVKLVVVGGDLKLWRKKTKETEETDREFATGDLDKTLWVEARAASGSLRDLELRLEYKGCQDTAKATAVWVVKNARVAAQGNNPWATRQAAAGFPDNPEPGAGKDLPDLTKASVLDYVNKYTDDDASGQRAADGSRYGHGPFHANNAGGTDASRGGRIVWEFKAQPPGADALGVELDVTRQIEYRDYKIESGKDTVDDDGSKTFPWLQAPKKDNEMPNDDSHSQDEDNTPSNDLIYSFDGPGHPRAAGTRAFVVSRNTFKEWVRVKVNNEAFANTQNTVEGSRASDKQDWHCVYYLKRDATGNWIADSNATDYSAPAGSGIGDGTAAVALQAGAVTEGFTATFAENKKWTLTGTAGGSVADSKDPAPAGTTWTLALPGKVTVTITQGATAFANGDKFVLSVFKTGDAAGKRNQTGTGSFGVAGAP